MPKTRKLRRLADAYTVTGFRPLARVQGIFGGMVSMKVEGYDLLLVDGRDSRHLQPHDPTSFFQGAQRYFFKMDEGGKVRGVDVVGPDYGESFVEHWAIDDTPRDPPGPDLPEWKPFLGPYVGKRFGEEITVNVSLKNGYLYVDWEASQKQTAYRDGLFFTANCESVEFRDGFMSVGNRPFRRAPHVAKVSSSSS